ncbi:MAG: hypothetical protein KA795_17550 [Burkholderiaceae bacterium]|nr:hypothetical protein [Burkholderiaceae bacterium]
MDDLLARIRASGADIDEDFRQLHHFAKHPPFNTRPLGFRRFESYCRGLARGIKPGEENEQTIQRTYAYVQMLDTSDRAAALREAWRLFPLAGTR